MKIKLFPRSITLILEFHDLLHVWQFQCFCDVPLGGNNDETFQIHYITMLYNVLINDFYLQVYNSGPFSKINNGYENKFLSSQKLHYLSM